MIRYRPALDIEQRFAQPDGTTFRASLHGDEYFSYVQTDDGHLVQKDSADQTWYYVVDEGATWSLGPRADEAAPASALTAASLAGDASEATYAALGGSGYTDTARGSGDVVTLADIEAAQGSSDAGTFGLRSTVQTETSLPLITIVIGFDAGESDDTEITANSGTWTAADQRYRDDYDWYEQLYGGEYSITNFYATMSKGQFSWVPATAETSAQGVDGNTNQHDEAGDGIIHVTLDRNHGNWKSPREEVVAADMREAYAEALHKASAYIDFSAYDTNGNGVLDKTEACILFINAGYEASAGASSPATWAFQWNLGSMDDSNPHPEVVDGIALDSFITMGETLYAEDAGIAAQPMSVGTVSHELGHYLGLPDLYDVNATASDPDATIGAYPWIPYDVYAASLMATGSWGRWTEDDGTLVFAPSSMDAYCLDTLGYIEPTTVAVDGTYDVSSFWSEGGYRCLRIPTSSDGEYFLVENRQYESFDKGLTTYYRDAGDEGDPAFYSDTAGIVVWHIDQTITSERDLQAADPSLQNTVNTVDHRPGVMPVYLELPAYDNSPLMYRPFYNADTFAAFGLDELSPLLHNGCAAPADRIASGIALVVDDDASDVMKVTVDMPEAQVTSLTPEVTTLGREGGAIEFAVAGQNLFDGVELRVYDETGTRIADAWATASSDPSDDPSARTATIAFPENIGDAPASYTVRAAYAGKEGVSTAAVSVEGRYAQRALSASLGDTNVEVAGAFRLPSPSLTRETTQAGALRRRSRSAQGSRWWVLEYRAEQRRDAAGDYHDDPHDEPEQAAEPGEQLAALAPAPSVLAHEPRRKHAEEAAEQAHAEVAELCQTRYLAHDDSFRLKGSAYAERRARGARRAICDGADHATVPTRNKTGRFCKRDEQKRPYAEERVYWREVPLAATYWCGCRLRTGRVVPRRFVRGAACDGRSG